MNKFRNITVLRIGQKGIGLVDLLVALVLSLILMAGVTQIYVSTRLSNQYSTNVSRMQESARYAVDMISKNVRMAGFMPCNTDTIANVVNGASTNPFIDLDRPIEGADQISGAVSTDWYANALDDTDAIKIIYAGGDDETYTVTQHVPTAAQLKVNRLHPFQDEDILLVCDPFHAAVFQATNVSSTNMTIVHNTGTGDPGNCTKGLGYPVVCTSNGTAYTFGEGSQVIQLQAKAYYIGTSSTGSGRSLYERRLVASTGAATTVSELVQDVENLQVLFGVDTDDDFVPERYVKAGDVSDWKTVVTARVWLIVATPEDLRDYTDSRDFDIAGETDLAIPTGEEGKHRYVFSSTIQLRNRVL
ncbi:MAG: PilW family protein [Sedimenticola sp.]